MQGDATGAGIGFFVYCCEVAFLVLFGIWSVFPTGIQIGIRSRIRSWIPLRVRSFFKQTAAEDLDDVRIDDNVPDEQLAQVVRPEVLYDRAFEVSRDLNAEIQGVENGLMAVLAAVAAVVVLAIDKLADLGLFVLVPLGIAFIACGFGYLHGRIRLRLPVARESEDPLRFFSDLIVNPDEAHQEGAEDLIYAMGPSRQLLVAKRLWVTVAICALMVGTLGGGIKKVIESRHEVRSTGQGQAEGQWQPGQVAPAICQVVAEAICP